MITVLVVDDNVTMRTGLQQLLDLADDIRVVGAVGDGVQAVEAVTRLRPKVTLMDVRMPRMDGLTAAGHVAALTRVVMLTSTEDIPVIQAALRLGIAGYLVHGCFRPTDLAAMIRDTTSGRAHMSPGPTAVALDAVGGRSARQRGLATRCNLSEREVRVLDSIAGGWSNNEVAQQLFLSPKTVKNHVNRIFAKLGVSSRSEAMAQWLGSTPEPAATWRAGDSARRATLLDTGR